MASITTVNLLALATSFPYAIDITTFNTTTPNVTFLSYDNSFSSVLGSNVSWKMIANETWQAFHEAGVYDQRTKSLYISSNWAGSSDNPINVTALNLDDYSVSSNRYPGLSSPNGGCTYVPPGTNSTPQLLFCDEGLLDTVSGLIIIDPKMNTTTPVVNTFLGRNFSSVNDVKQHYSTGDLWFTDASYGWLQFFRPAPSIPNQVYRLEPLTGRISVVASDFVNSNGIEFSPDFKTLYVTDTGAQGSLRLGVNGTGPATIYAFDVVNEKYLRNKRVFAYVDVGFPDGIHTDTEGNVWSGCGDGVHVWNSDGTLLGKIKIEAGAANFAFIPGAMIIFNEYRLFWVRVAAVGREVARDFGVSS